jgi:hypothetical protein
MIAVMKPADRSTAPCGLVSISQLSQDLSHPEPLIGRAQGQFPTPRAYLTVFLGLLGPISRPCSERGISVNGIIATDILASNAASEATILTVGGYVNLLISFGFVMNLVLTVCRHGANATILSGITKKWRTVHGVIISTRELIRAVLPRTPEVASHDHNRSQLIFPRS